MKEDQGSYYFRYMGRSQFKQLYELAQSPSFLHRHQKIYLYGSSGSGKSHLLVVLADFLIRTGETVVYIPDCLTLAQDFVGAMTDAFCFTFPESANAIASFKSVNDLVEFSRNKRTGDVPFYIIVDQLNALESNEPQPSKADAKQSLERITYGHRYIFSASANEQSNQRANERQSATTVMKLHGGMDDLC
ncbi:hypothetical protein L208DRAFT_1402996 [Tricholoma matsutake]|nr:hypothetical protein L208DRAFT_1402996 [Tricholoma matsutake 945]